MAQKNLHRALQAKREKNKENRREGRREKKSKEQVQEINIPPHPSITAIVLVT